MGPIRHVQLPPDPPPPTFTFKAHTGALDFLKRHPEIKSWNPEVRITARRHLCLTLQDWYSPVYLDLMLDHIEAILDSRH